MKRRLFIALCLFAANGLFAQEAAELIKQSEEILRGVESSHSSIKMTIQRPKYNREMEIKSWTKSDKYALIYLEEPVRDKGTVFLKRDKEIWNWVPSIEKVIKLPPSMMMQSWMGSDFTNDDLVKSSSMVDDYDQEMLEEETVNGVACHTILLSPKPEAAIVWGKVKLWIAKETYIQMKVEFYDEDDYLINTMDVLEVQDLNGRMLPRIVELTPNDEPENKTIIEYLDFAFNEPIDESFFTVQNMKRLRL